MYNLTNLTNATTIIEQTEVINAEVGGVIGILLLAGLYIVLIMSFSRWGFSKSLIVSSFATTLIGTLLFYLGWIPYYILLVPILILFSAVIYELLTG